MNTQLLEIEPKELDFVFILKKPCSCSVRLTNKTDQHIAFKVKTTSPKKYCVRPNVGIIMPKARYDFTVIMQAQREAPPDLICRDKFLIQSTVVPVGTNDEDITSATFVKDSGRYIEEHKLKVAFISPPHSPVWSTINGTVNQGTDYDASIPKEPEFSRFGIHAPLQTVRYALSTFGQVAKVEEPKMINLEDLKPTKDVGLKPRKDINDDLKLTKYAELKLNNNFFNSKELKPLKDVEAKPRENVLDTEEFKSVKEKEFNELKDGEVKTLKSVEELKFAKDVEEMKSKLTDLESKLGEAEATISKLTEERRLSTQERKILEEELVSFLYALLRKKANIKRAKVGYPLLFVCMVALISVYIGYLLAPLTKSKASMSDLYQQMQ
ncbi:vesicle-associated protein 2-2-like isoform X1 [Gossypium australe]|uniref:Vesicle-associated protein 2-2-like isoform X1 n=1 Tax=Gossypium australe TaxID=47621 RepID=A0A5B6X0A6_9ROSI|nr:vesicle-associated protein 2-2-like isoform X1 [Gossypium australe]